MGMAVLNLLFVILSSSFVDSFTQIVLMQSSLSTMDFVKAKGLLYFLSIMASIFLPAVAGNDYATTMVTDVYWDCFHVPKNDE